MLNSHLLVIISDYFFKVGYDFFSCVMAFGSQQDSIVFVYRGIMRLDGAWGKKQVWRPHI